MSAKELVLIPKHKYQLLSEKHTPDSVSVETQTEESLIKETPDSANAVSQTDIEKDSVNISADVSQAVRSTSWDLIPGYRAKMSNAKRNRSIKWLPY